jgi:hypothetical protein
MKFDRVYHPITEWEEMNHNMWGDVADRKEWLSRAISFTGNHKLYGEHMRKVIQQWPISCENALTDYSLNRRAWIGHAAVALAINCPEDITRQAWGVLTHEQRLLANQEADRTIRLWEHAYAKSRGLHHNMGGSLL